MARDADRAPLYGSNYGSEEADLTDAIIKDQETIKMPNTRAFFDSVKIV